MISLFVLLVTCVALLFYTYREELPYAVVRSVRKPLSRGRLASLSASVLVSILIVFLGTPDSFSLASLSVDLSPYLTGLLAGFALFIGSAIFLGRPHTLWKMRLEEQEGSYVRWLGK